MGCAQSTPVEEPTASAPPASTPLPPPAEPAAEAEPAAVATEPEVEAATPEEPVKQLYKVSGHEIDEAGVVYYTVEPTEGEGSFKKRYSEFKALVVELGHPKSLPALPSAGLVALARGKHNPAVLKERETQLAVVLNAIANDAELSEKDAVKSFLA
ncbi:hypothetical protein BBJ28_00012447 [Nothophytophthora sp. Chile5]|nr:hypothetical protein BBJ28_00012447 [Nothophytophthora sp. Chile5]